MKLTKNIYKCLFIFAIFISLLLLIKLISCANNKENFEIKSQFINRIAFPKFANQRKESSDFNDGEFILFRQTIPSNSYQVTFNISSRYEFIYIGSGAPIIQRDILQFSLTPCITINNYYIKDDMNLKGTRADILFPEDTLVHTTENKLTVVLPANIDSNDLVDVIVVLTLDSNTLNTYKLRLDNMNIAYEIVKDKIYRSSTQYKQKSNTIYNQVIEPNNSNLSNMLYQISLNDNYFINQIHISNLSEDHAEYDLIIGIKNNNLNELTYVDLTDNINKNKIMKMSRNSEEYISSFKATFGKYNDGIFIDNIKDMFGNEILGDEIQIYTNVVLNSRGNTMLSANGYLGSEKFDYKKTTSEPQINIIPPDYHLKTNVSNTSATPHKDNFNVKYIQFKKNTNITDTPTPTDVKIKFKNSYTNNIMTYNGYGDNNQFILKLSEDEANNTAYIYLTRRLVASEIEIVSSDGEPGISDYYTINYYGDRSTSSDINRFILENNISDIKGSINPDLICPSIKTLMNDTLDAELIVEAMDYQNKINTEKTKLSGNKENLLILLEQSEDIKKLEKMVDKIKSISRDNDEHVSVLNSLQFKKNMEDYQVLKEFLDKRINTRKNNTADINVNVFSSELTNALNDAASDSEIFLNLEDNMKIN